MSREKQIEEMEKLQDRLIKRSCNEFNLKTSLLLTEAANAIGTLLDGYRKQKEGENIARHPSSAFECSICKWENWDLATGDGAYNYCPNCGAKMKGGA